MTLLEKLQKIQLELKVHKGQRNNFGNYNYRSAEDILEAIKPMQEKYKVVFQITERLREVGGVVFVESNAIIRDLEKVEDEIESFASAIIDFEAKGMQNPQRTGSASSYAKKYALGNLLLIDDTKDSDATNTHNKASSKKSIKIGTPEFQKAKQALSLGKVTIEQLKSKYNVSDVVAEQLSKQ